MPRKKVVALTLAVMVLWLESASASAVVDRGAEQSRADDKDSELHTIPDQAAVRYYRAVLRLQAGAKDEAMELLAQCLDLHKGIDPSASAIFGAVMPNSAEWRHRLAEVHREFPPASKAQLVFVTQERELVTEGLAYDARRDLFYLGSLNQRKIVSIASNGAVSDLVPRDRDGLLPILGIRLDPSDGSVWAASSSEETDRSELLHFSFAGGLLARHAMHDQGRHGFNDLVVRRDGSIVLTDSVSNQVYQFDRPSNAFKPIQLGRRLYEPNGIALSDDDRTIFVADDFGVQRLDLLTGRSSEVDPGPRNTLAGADGLYWHRGSLVAIQNAIGSPRIASFKLSPDGNRVLSTTVLEYRSGFLSGELTTGAIKGDDLYFIVNSQADNMKNDRVVDPAKLEPVRIGKIRLP